MVIGGGPTGVEFSGELSDFIIRDVRDRYAHIKDDIKVTLIEVPFISNFRPQHCKENDTMFVDFDTSLHK